ncbi:MAG: CBS domain-containing protein [Gammaproteobacteria bacterium]|nr:CBS domain-containing protein [Gammaproteobacteria bacterium]NNC77638.1 CBS domain-containing protein [Woeseiaceae bacterium]
MKLVQHILEAKGRNVISISPDASVLDAVKMMADKGIGSLIVLNNGEMCGIVTERDYARKVIIKGRSSDETPVSEIMTDNVVTTSPGATVDSCMQTMTDKKCRHLPVLEDDHVVAMISIGDLVQAIIADQKEEIHQLEQYIAG